MYGDDFVKRTKRIRYKFKVGDQVRISKKKGIFKKGYTPNWTEEVFTVAQRLRRIPPVYRIKEYDGSKIKGTFYEQELERVRVKEDDFFKVEKILKTKGVRTEERILGTLERLAEQVRSMDPSRLHEESIKRRFQG